jgi:hypothetical protein
MINLSPTIDRINALLTENTNASVTYAALEARLALEKVCYNRLRQCHDYISHDQLKRWQPHAVVNTLIAEVDAHAIHTRTLMMSRNPAVPGVEPDDDDFVEIGTEVGFNPKLIGELWNALSGLALHVKLPKNKDDRISEYGDADRTKKKVEEVVAELERIATGTMTFSGIGEEVSFECACGEKNKRRASLLKGGQSISCFNALCIRSYTVEIDDDGSHSFTLQAAEIPCAACDKIIFAPMREVTKMKHGEVASIRCSNCDHTNRIAWLLMRADRATNTDAATD